jgi:RimJ/RimL family protein N-acetyltransferase
MLIRPASLEDVEFIGSIRVAAWQAAYRCFMPDAYLDSLDPTENLDGLRAALCAEIPPLTLCIAETEEMPMAFSVLGKPRYDANHSVAELWALNVHPSHWRKGAGQQLVRRALLDAREQKFTSVELWCIRGNLAAERLYEACGFVSNGQVRTTNFTGYPLHESGYSCAL